MNLRGIPKPLARIGAASVVALSLSAPALGADISAADTAAATAIFEEAHTLFEQGKIAEALAKYEASHRIEPTAGKLLNIARCQEKLGRTASAWGSLHEAEIIAKTQGDEERRAFVVQWENELSPRLAHLRIEVAPEVQSFRILLDKKSILPGALSTALPVDPGEHVVVAEADGRPRWQTTVHIEAKPGTTTVRVPAPSAGPSPPFWNGQRIAGVAVGGVGGASVVVGAIFGVRAKNAMDDSKPHCVDLNPDPCDRQGVTLRDEATTAAWVSNIAIGGGVAAIAGGVVLVLTAPSPKAPEPTTAVRFEILPVATPAMQGLIVRGRL